MKRLLDFGFAALLLLPGTAASAQHTVSLLGGMNLTVIANHSTDGLYPVAFQRTTGANLGIATSFMLSPPDAGETLSLQLAGTHSQKGGILGEGGVDFELDYLELALLANARFPSIVDGVFIRFFVGPALGWLRSCQRSRPATDDQPGTSNPCGEGEFRSRDHSVVAGSGLELRFVDRLWVTTSFLYTIGLGYFDHGDENSDGVLKHRALTLRTGLSIPIGSSRRSKAGS